MAHPGGALVTGAARGLGLQIARALAARGLAVHLTDVDADAAAAAAAAIGGRAWSSPLDVTDADACRAAAAATAERAGTLAVWVNNAGVLRTGPAWSHSDAERRLVWDVNAGGTVNGTVAALEVMRPQATGHVVNIVSLAGLVAVPGETLYAASKHAALAFSVGALHDLRAAGHRDIHVSALCPDGVWTPMLHRLVDDPSAAMSWSGRLVEAADVARAALSLLDRPRPVLALPRRRGAAARLADAFPRLGLALSPVVLARARRRQREFGARNRAPRA